jgi:hypothetical protein
MGNAALEVTGKRFISHTAAARQRGVCTKTIDRWVEKGLIERPTVINGRKYHAIETIEVIGQVKSE